VLVDGASLAIGTKVGIVAHGTLVPVPDDVGSSTFVLTEGPIAVNTIVLASASRWGFNRLINGDEAMSRVYEASIRDAIRAVIPVGAVEALMANAIDRLIAAIADGIMVEIPTRAKECFR